MRTKSYKKETGELLSPQEIERIVKEIMKLEKSGIKFCLEILCQSVTADQAEKFEVVFKKWNEIKGLI